MYTISNIGGKYKKLEGIPQNIFLKEEVLRPHNLSNEYNTYFILYFLYIFFCVQWEGKLPILSPLYVSILRNTEHLTFQ